MAYAAGRGASGGQDQAEPQPDEVPAAPPPPAPTSGDTEVEELQKLAQLHDAGALTDDEFAAEKAKILGA
ncbi:MAG: SHOCT domain-containing protein [Gaiellaceae bacterium]